MVNLTLKTSTLSGNLRGGPKIISSTLLWEMKNFRGGQVDEAHGEVLRVRWIYQSTHGSVLLPNLLQFNA